MAKKERAARKTRGGILERKRVAEQKGGREKVKIF